MGSGQGFTKSWVAVVVVLVLILVGGSYMIGEKTVAAAQGPTGAKGDAGPIGPTGLQGQQGTQGVDGSEGLQGIAGATGARGPQGLTGASGSEVNVATFLKTGHTGGSDVTLATSGPFTLIGRCAALGGGLTEAETYLHSTDNGSQATNYSQYGDDGTNESYIFSSLNTEMQVGYFAEGNSSDPTSMSGPYDGTFAALTSTNDRYITGLNSTAVTNADTTPVCVWSGFVRTILP